VTWKHIAAGATLIALALAFWMFKPAPPATAPVAPQDHTEPVTPDSDMLAFGLDATARYLTLHSKLDEDVEWSVRTGSRFEIAPEIGTIKAFGSTTVRVRPRSSSLTVGLNSEHTWFTWRTANGPTRELLVRLTAIRAPEVEYNVVAADEVIFALNGTAVARVKKTNGWRRLAEQHGLKAGDNRLDVRAVGSRQGGSYILMLRVGSNEIVMTEATKTPVTITLDPDLGFVTLSPGAPRARAEL
jgi:hypothetical protein